MTQWPVRTTIAAALVASGAFAIYTWWPTPTPPPGTAQPIAPAKVLKKTPTIDIKPPKVRVYAPKAKKDLGLPQAAQEKPTEHVTTVKPDLRAHTIITTLDETTGQFTTYDKPEPLPWLAFSRRGEAGMAYGYSSSGQTGWRLYARQDLLQIKRLNIGAQAALDQGGQWFAGVAVGVRW